MGHALMENRHGLLVDFQLTQATGTAERDVVPQLLYDASCAASIRGRWVPTRRTTPARASRPCASAA